MPYPREAHATGDSGRVWRPARGVACRGLQIANGARPIEATCLSSASTRRQVSGMRDSRSSTRRATLFAKMDGKPASCSRRLPDHAQGIRAEERGDTVRLDVGHRPAGAEKRHGVGNAVGRLKLQSLPHHSELGFCPQLSAPG